MFRDRGRPSLSSLLRGGMRLEQGRGHCGKRRDVLNRSDERGRAVRPDAASRTKFAAQGPQSPSSRARCTPPGMLPGFFNIRLWRTRKTCPSAFQQPRATPASSPAKLGIGIGKTGAQVGHGASVTGSIEARQSHNGDAKDGPETKQTLKKARQRKYLIHSLH